MRRDVVSASRTRRWDLAWRSDLKGFTVFRPRLPAGEVLVADEQPDALCCEPVPQAS